MRLSLSVVLVVAMSLVRAQPQDNAVRIPLGENLITGTEVEFGLGTILSKSLELVVAPRSFKKNWPFYGYAVRENSSGGPCHNLNEEYSNLAIGKAALVMEIPHNTDVGSWRYMGLPVQDTTNTVTGSSGSAVPEWIRSGLSIRDLCGRLDDQSVLDAARQDVAAALDAVWQDVAVLPYDSPDGDRGISNDIDPVQENWYLLTEEPLPALDTDVRISAHSLGVGD